MKLQFLATAQAPDSYEIAVEEITAHKGEQSEEIDLSPIEEGGQFQGIELDTLELPASQVIRNAERKNGELYVTLCQQAGSGHWRKSEWIDADDYDPEQIYIKRIDTDGNTEA